MPSRIKDNKKSTKSKGNKNKLPNTQKKSAVKKKTSSLIRGYFGSSYKKNVAIRQAQINAEKITSKKGLLKFISDAQDNKLFIASKKIPVVLYQIILIMNLLGKSGRFKNLSIQKNPLVANIIFSKSNWIVKFNRLSSFLIYQLEQSKNIALNKNPEVIIEMFNTFSQIQQILTKKVKVNFLNPEVLLNVLVFSLNSKLMYEELSKNGNTQIYYHYFNQLDNLKNKGNVPSDFEKKYILLLQDIINCDIDSSECDKQSKEIYNYSFVSQNDKRYLQFKELFSKLKLSTKYKTNDNLIRPVDEINKMLIKLLLNSDSVDEYTKECKDLLKFELYMYNDIVNNGQITGTKYLDINDANVLNIYKNVNIQCRKADKTECKKLGLLYHPDKNTEYSNADNFVIYNRIQEMLQTIYSNSSDENSGKALVLFNK